MWRVEKKAKAKASKECYYTNEWMSATGRMNGFRAYRLVYVFQHYESQWDMRYFDKFLIFFPDSENMQII